MTMTRDEAIKYVKAHIKAKYHRHKILAAHRGVSEQHISRSIRELAPWLLEECGLTAQVKVTYVAKDRA